MKISRLILFFLLVISVNGLLSWLSNLPQDAGPDVPDGKISSVSFAPFREGQSPLTEVFPTSQEIDEDLRLLSTETHTIRTYASTRGLTDVAAMAQKYGLNVIQGAWIGGMTMAEENQAEIDQLIKVANQYPDVIKRVIVGNEVLLRGELKPEQLLQYIRQVKKAVKQPVSYADVWSFYMRYPEIAKEVDFFTVHILPYWEDEPLTIEETAAHIEKNYRKIREAYPDKPILIGESGWPSAGRQRGWAVPSVVNEAKFIRSLVQLANKNGFDYNVVEAFNQPWKSQLEGVVGANWGLYSADRKLVFPLTGNVTENPLWLKQLLYAGLITLLVVGWQSKALVELGTLRLLGFIGFTQLLSVLLINQIAGNWYTSYSLIERLHALCIAGLSLLLGALILRRTLDGLSDKIREKSGVWIRYLVLAFVAIALYKSQALALNGRYLSFPSPQTIIPVIGIVGFMLMSYFTKGKNLTFAQAINDLFGTQTLSMKWAKITGLVLVVTGLSLIIIETAFVMQNSNYEQAYPIVTERIYAALMVTINYSQLFGWTMLITAVLFKTPLRTGAYALVFMVLAIIVGETCTFLMGHDFIESYPNVGERIWIAFVYTITNPQLLLWLASLLILALPLWQYRDNKISGA
ncbi:glycoside hydrolase family 17 protein [Methylobacter psychrophilus]|uniref:glycoside hydrolase family 17 protein n=1 Tax=Methylobacter psychrophilus TaxID=96941 RepID=UPI0021D50724|nr:exo-beta-1,3-glucanase [Methylobacter psychrophilus]